MKSLLYIPMSMFTGFRKSTLTKVRMIHRNLLLSVNFLPVDELQEPDQEDNDVNDEIDVRGDEVNHDERTANLILSHPDDFVEEDVNTNHTDLPDESDCVSEMLDSSVGAGNLNDLSDVRVKSDVKRSYPNVTNDLPEVQGQDFDLTRRELFTNDIIKEPMECAHSQDMLRQQQLKKTRLGRVIKPPKRQRIDS